MLWAAPAGATPPLSIAVQPFGRIGPGVVREVEADIAGEFNCRVTVLKPVPLPASAYYKPRKRYRAEKLLAFLDRHTPASFDKIIGLTRKDISTTKGWYCRICRSRIERYLRLGGRTPHPGGEERNPATESSSMKHSPTHTTHGDVVAASRRNGL